MSLPKILIRALLGPMIFLSSCSPEPHDARPALWRIEDGHGRAGWLFGTIHSSDRPIKWRTSTVDTALNQSRTIIVEVSNLADEKAVSDTFARLARSEGEPPLLQRVPEKHRSALAALLEKSGQHDADFATVDTWAAALMLARAGAEEADTRNGVDRAVIASANGRSVTELEGAAAQLGLFDSLPESEQRDLLAAVVIEAAQPDRGLAKNWRSGNMQAIEKETRSGLLADPELREVLFVGRNRRWTERIEQSVRSGQMPFVAVGAAHMAGPQGLPAMLAAEGLTVTRVE